MSNFPNLQADLQSLLQSPQYVPLASNPQGNSAMMQQNMQFRDPGQHLHLHQQQAAATWMTTPQQQQERMTELAMQELQNFLRQPAIPPDNNLPYQVYPVAHRSQEFEGLYSSMQGIRQPVEFPSAQLPNAREWMEQPQPWPAQPISLIPQGAWAGQGRERTLQGDLQHRAIYETVLTQMRQGSGYGMNVNSEVQQLNSQLSNWSGYQRGFRGKSNFRGGGSGQFVSNFGAEGKRWQRVKPSKGLLDNFEGDGPACIKLLNEYGQKNSCTVQYDSPIIPTKPDGEEKDSSLTCSVTVIVVDSNGQTVVQGKAEGMTKKLAKQGAAAQAICTLFPQEEENLRSKGLLEDVVKPSSTATAHGGETGSLEQGTEQGEQEGASGARSAMMVNPVLHLQHACSRLHKMMEFSMREEGPPHSKTFHADVVIEGVVMGRGTAPKKKGAQGLAAREALGKLELEGWSNLQPPPGMDGERSNKRKRHEEGEEEVDGEGDWIPEEKRRSSQPATEGKQLDVTQSTKLLHAHCSKNRLKLEYKVVEAGPAHARIFTVEAVIEGKVCGCGVSGKKKAATALAAQQVIESMGIDVVSLFKGGKGSAQGKVRPEDEGVNEVLEEVIRRVEADPEHVGGTRNTDGVMNEGEC